MRDICFSTPRDKGNSGAMSGGRLKEAKIVNESLTANSAKLEKGTDRGGVRSDAGLLNILVNWLSLYRLKLILTPEVARNLAGPAVVASAERCRMVLDIVSIVLAVVYVPK